MLKHVTMLTPDELKFVDRVRADVGLPQAGTVMNILTYIWKVLKQLRWYGLIQNIWHRNIFLYFTSNATYGEKIDTIPNTKCPNCLEKMVEDDKFGEQIKEIKAFEVTHNSWEMLGYNERKEKINRELFRQGYLK